MGCHLASALPAGGQNVSNSWAESITTCLKNMLKNIYCPKTVKNSTIMMECWGLRAPRFGTRRGGAAVGYQVFQRGTDWPRCVAVTGDCFSSPLGIFKSDPVKLLKSI